MKDHHVRKERVSGKPKEQGGVSEKMPVPTFFVSEDTEGYIRVNQTTHPINSTFISDMTPRQN